MDKSLDVGDVALTGFTFGTAEDHGFTLIPELHTLIPGFTMRSDGLLFSGRFPTPPHEGGDAI
jgi:hypothetical protein